jgi:hypothetical protein
MRPYDIRRLVADQLHRGRSIAGGQKFEAFAGQVAANEFDQQRLVIDDEDARGSVGFHVRRVWEKPRERKDREPSDSPAAFHCPPLTRS